MKTLKLKLLTYKQDKRKLVCW